MIVRVQEYCPGGGVGESWIGARSCSLEAAEFCGDSPRLLPLRGGNCGGSHHDTSSLGLPLALGSNAWVIYSSVVQQYVS